MIITELKKFTAITILSLNWKNILVICWIVTLKCTTGHG